MKYHDKKREQPLKSELLFKQVILYCLHALGMYEIKLVLLFFLTSLCNLDLRARALNDE